MTKEAKRILIVEDDMIIGANISLQLTKLGYEVDGLVPRGEDALAHVKKNIPDILLLDINLKGRLNGIETALAIRQIADIPIVYLTANSDEATFEKAKETRPRAFVTKPFKKLDLARAIALVVEQLGESKRNVYPNEIQVLKDRIFVRHNGKMEKLLFQDILYIEADRNYCTIVTDVGRFTLSCTLKKMEKKLIGSPLVRIHRSYILNILKLDVIADHHIEIDRKVIPIGKSHKEMLMSRIHTI